MPISVLLTDPERPWEPLTEELEFTQRIDFPAKAENIALAEKLIDEACQSTTCTRATTATSSSPLPKR
jgi:hypothetical protein